MNTLKEVESIIQDISSIMAGIDDCTVDVYKDNIKTKILWLILREKEKADKRIYEERKKILLTANEKLLSRNIPETVGYSVAVEYIYELTQAVNKIEGYND